MRRVSFQGERGAYSESAAISFFGEIETLPYQTFSEVLQSTAEGDSDFSILPVENSLEGTVGESSDLLYSTPLYVIGETYHRIEHCLIGRCELKDARTVYSHPQALGQCRNFIQKYNMKTIPTYDTAGSVRIIGDLDQGGIACIASRMASEIYGVPVIMEGIADNRNNHTRFLILSKSGCAASERDKTSIIFSVKHEPGALYKILENFAGKGANLTKIESRPKKETAWEYNFYVDFEGNKNEEDTARMLGRIRDDSIFFKVLGSYPMASLD